MRIGDILLADGVIDARDLDAALSEQLVSRASEQATGGRVPRLGSILFRRGLVPADVVARALARQQAVPAALSRHLQQRDPALAALVPAELARRYVALPVAQTRSDEGLALIVCMRDPADPAAISALSRAARMPVVAAVACEAVLAPLVESVYAQAAAPALAPAAASRASSPAIGGPFAAALASRASSPAIASAPTLTAAPRASSPAIARPTPTPAPVAPPNASLDEIDIDFDTGPIVTVPYDLPTADDPLDPLSSGSFQLVGLDDEGVTRDDTQIAPTTNRQSNRISAASIAHDATLPPAAPIASIDPPRLVHDAPTLDGALARIGQTTHRDDIADAAIAYLGTRWSSAVVLVVRDALALGHRGFGGALTPTAVESIVVPLNQPSVLRTAHDRRAPYVGPPTETSVVQDRFLRAVAAPPGGEVTVIPVSLRERVVCLVFAHGLLPGHAHDAAFAELRALAHAMEDSFLRLIRDKRARTEL